MGATNGVSARPEGWGIASRSNSGEGSSEGLATTGRSGKVSPCFAPSSAEAQAAAPANVTSREMMTSRFRAGFMVPAYLSRFLDAAG